MNKSFISGTSLILVFVIFLAINGISDKLFSRFYIDLTEEGLYTLSKGTREILAEMDQPLTLKFYHSKTDGDKNPYIKLYGTRVRDLLKEYERKSKGNVKLEIFDPRPDTEDEEWAEKYGITPIDLPTGERIYLGLVGISAMGQEDVIPFFNINRQEFLEYDITKMIYSLSSSAQPVVGLISTLPVTGEKSPSMPQQFPPQPQQTKSPWIFVNQLSKLVELKNLPQELQAIPEEITTLFVIHPRGLSENTLYAIDQFVLRGGNLFVAVDPFCMTDSPPRDPSNPMAGFSADRSSSLNELTGKWGVELIEDKVVGDLRLSTRVNVSNNRQENFIMWLTVDHHTETISSDDVITGALSSIMLPWSGALKLNEVEGINSEILLSTTRDSMLYDEKDMRFIAEDNQAILKKFAADSNSYPIAVRLSGEFQSTFDAPPGEDVKNFSEEGGHLSRSIKPATVIVIADVDFMADDYSAYKQRFLGAEIVTLLNDNLNLVSNIAENLSGNDQLISLRSRGKFARPFSKVQEIESRAQKKYQAKEENFQQAIRQANSRLAELQSGLEAGQGTTILNEALLEEIEKIREEKLMLQKELRQVRRALREDKERLGTNLFLLNTFLVPVILLLTALFISFRNNRKKNI